MKVHLESNAGNHLESDIKEQISRKQDYIVRINLSQSCSSYASVQDWHLKSTNKSSCFTHNLIKRNEQYQNLWETDVYWNVWLKHRNNDSFNWYSFKVVEWTAIHQSMKSIVEQKQHQACVHKRIVRYWWNCVFDWRQNNQSKSSIRNWKENQRLIACEYNDRAKFTSKIYVKMPIEWITEREIKPLFKIFLRRIWFKNYDEYLELFGSNIEKRRETVQRFRETYPNLTLSHKQQEKWKD